MHIGGQRVPVEIWHKVQTGTDQFNMPIFEEKVWKTDWAKVASRRGQEHAVGAEIFSLTTYYFEFRHMAVDGINSAMWLVLDGQKFDIRDVQPDYQRRDVLIVQGRARGINMSSTASISPFSLTAAVIAGPWVGYQRDAAGSISAEPVGGSELDFFATSPASASMAFWGEDIISKVSNLQVHVDGSLVEGEWSLDGSGTSITWSPTSFSFVSGETYLIELK